MEKKRAKEDSDALFLIQRSHFLDTSDSTITVLVQMSIKHTENTTLQSVKSLYPNMAVLILVPALQMVYIINNEEMEALG